MDWPQVHLHSLLCTNPCKKPLQQLHILQSCGAAACSLKEWLVGPQAIQCLPTLQCHAHVECSLLKVFIYLYVLHEIKTDIKQVSDFAVHSGIRLHMSIFRSHKVLPCCFYVAAMPAMKHLQPNVLLHAEIVPRAEKAIFCKLPWTAVLEHEVRLIIGPEPS